MKNTNVIISGISGQDGLFLTSELLKNSNISVYGVTRGNNHEDFFRRLSYIDPDVNFSNIKMVNIDLKNLETTKQFISEVKPGKFFNLTGPSSVFESIRTPKLAKRESSSLSSEIFINPNTNFQFLQACFRPIADQKYEY